MAALFNRSANLVFGLTVTAVFGAVAAVPVGLVLYMQSPDAHAQFIPVDQPVAFDHRHHVRDDGIDCFYCHSEARISPSAGVPSTELCMGCHNQVWSSSIMIEPIRQSYFADRPIAWNRVHALPEHVHFNHAIHVNRGIGCVSCHGRVDQMARVEKVAPLTMQWCLECHRHPESRLRPLSAITDMEWRAPGDPEAFGQRMAREYGVRRLTHCTTCHR